jgi:hypothetical protein
MESETRDGHARQPRVPLQELIMSSSNPYTFESPSSTGYVPQPSGRMTGFTKAIFIIHLILGTLGILGSIVGLFVLALFPVIQSAMNNGQQDAPTLEFFPGATILAYVTTLIGFVVSIAMVWGGIAGLNYKSLGLSLIRNVSLFMMIYKLIELPYTLVVQHYSAIEQKKQFAKNMEANPNAPDVSQFLEIGQYIGIGMAIFFAIGMIVFYTLCFLNLGKAEVKANFH